MIFPSISRPRLKKVLQELIRIESVNPSLDSAGSGEKNIAIFLHEYLSKLGLAVIRQEVITDRFNTIGILKGKGKGKTLLLNGHMDTVGITGMAIDPLKPDFLKGNIYGRGSADMKSGIAAMLAACESLIPQKNALDGEVIFSFVIDEEYRSAGTEKLLKSFFADAAIVCEPTDLKIGMAHKGFVWGNVTIFGKPAHGSRPEEGIDAIVKAGKFLIEIENLEKTELVKKNHPLLGQPSMHCSKIEGGKEPSTYPDQCKIQLERRTIPGEDESTFQEELEGIIKKLQSEDPQFRAESEIFFHRPPLEISENASIVRTLKQAYQNVLKQKPEKTGISWWMDSALIANAGIPAVAFGPCGTGLHAAVEYVNFQSVVKTAAVLVQTIMDYCRI